MNKSNAEITPTQPKFSVAITTEKYQKLVNNTLGEPDRARRFIASITSAVAVNPALQECDAGTILAGALLGESLNLSPSPQLGQYYLVPFKSKEKRDRDGNVTEPACVKAQFVLGYKGYIQLAIRSGQYKKINVIEIKEGELKHFDALNEEINCILIDDFAKREAAPTVGYYVMFEYVNGFRKAMYWTKEKMLSHADTYSPAFSAKAYADIQAGRIADKDMWRYSSFWYKDFDGMAKKTMLRQIISKWGVMSVDLQLAFERDSSMASVSNNGVIDITPESDLPMDTHPAGDSPFNATPEFTEVHEQIDLDSL